MLRGRPFLALTAAVAGAFAMLPAAAMPLVIGAAVDEGIASGRFGVLTGWIAVVLGLALVQASARGVLTWTSHTMWIHGATCAQRALVQQAVALGATLPKRAGTGDVVAMGSEDVYRVGDFLELFGRTIGAAVSFAMLTAALIWISPPLGSVALVGVPVAVLGIGLLLRPLRERGEHLREQFSEVNALGADIVAGLRVLRGIGGERAFVDRFVAASRRVLHAGCAVGSVRAWVSAAEVALAGLVLVVVTWLGARFALEGTISTGELIAFYGASAFLVVPVTAAGEAAEELSAALVAARRIDRLLRHRPEPIPPQSPVPLPEGSLSLATDGLFVPSGKLTVLDPDRGLVEHLAGYVGDDLRVGDVPMNQVDPAELRKRVVLLRGDDLWFSGPVGEELAAGHSISVERAVWAAAAPDVIDAIGGYPDEVSERGRSVSGGQRQRLLLARALTLDPDVLVLEEPTSAVDAHTEARIVERVAELRTGRTTVVLTASPLWRGEGMERKRL